MSEQKIETRANHFTIELKSLDGKEDFFSLKPDASILDSAREAGIRLASYCKQGGCGVCEVKLLSGIASYRGQLAEKLPVPKVGENVRLCSLCPQSNLVVQPPNGWGEIGRAGKIRGD